MGVPYTFANATTSIPLSQLDSNFGTAITVGNTAVYLGNTVTTLNNMTLANVTVSSGNVTFTQGSIGGNVTINTTGTANVGNTSVAGTLGVTGTLGVGISSPSTTAEIYKATYPDFQLSDAAGRFNKLAVNSDNADPFAGFFSDSPWVWMKATGNVRRMTLDGSGNLGLGVTPSAWSNTYKAVDVNIGGSISGYASGSTYGTGLAVNAVDASGWKYKNGSAFAALFNIDSGGNFVFYNTTSAQGAGNPISFNAAMTLDSSGNLLVGTTNASDTAGDGTKIWPNGDKPRISMVGNSTSSVEYPFMIRSSANSTWRMYVDWAGNIYAQNTAITSLSDIRLKENVRDLETGLDTVLALKPRRFDWKNGEAQNVAGFIAQEVEPVMPELVTTGIDADEAGDKYKMLAPGNLIPTLVKAIQELSAKNDALEARLAALEAA